MPRPGGPLRLRLYSTTALLESARLPAFSQLAAVTATATAPCINTPATTVSIGQRCPLRIQIATMSSTGGGKERKTPAVPKPSSSVVLLSPRNQILLLCRVKTSSSFASAHVFPGGNVDLKQDGSLPREDSFERHEDGPAYRLAAIRECFEESGLLLAKPASSSASSAAAGSLLSVPRSEREQARRDVHSNKVKFVDWLASRGGVPDVDGLRAFTRFVTPTTVPRRFTTQMYVYMLPLEAVEESRLGENGGSATPQSGGQALIPTPTSDGGVEHTAAQFLWPDQWLGLARSNEIIMYPPQVYLISLIAPFFPQGDWSPAEKQRDRCLDFLQSDTTPPWADKVMSPVMELVLDDGQAVLGLNNPGPELRGSGRAGDAERVILTRHSREGPRDVSVRWKREVMHEYRRSQNTPDKGKI